MARDIRGKSAYIKRVDWTITTGVPSNETLESLLVQALSIQDNLREWKPSEQHPLRRSLAKGQQHDDGIAWSFVTFEIGKSVEMVSTNQESGNRDLVPMAIPQVAGEDRQKLEGALYFAVSGDRLAVSQSLVLRISTLEEHLNWLLRDRMRLFQTGSLLLLDDAPGNVQNQITTHGVKEVHLGTTVSELIEGADARDAVINLVGGMLGRRIGANWTDHLGRGFRSANLSGIKTKIELSASTKRGEDALRLMNAIALGMRHDLSGVTLVLGNGEEIKGTSLVHKRKFRLEFFDGVPSLTQMYACLRAQLAPDGNTEGIISDDDL